MRHGQDVQQKNWFMRKRGKHWVFGCSLLLVGLGMLGLGRPVLVAAEEQNPTIPASVTVQDGGGEVAETASLSEGAVVDEAVPSAPEASLVAPETSPVGEEAEVGEQPLAPTAEPVPQTPPASESVQVPVEEVTPVSEEKASHYQTNLEGLDHKNGTWEVRQDGLYSNALDKGDSFLYTQSQGDDFVYETEVTFLQDKGAAALIMRSNNDADNKESYAVNIDASNKKVKFWRWQENSDYHLIDEREIKATADNRYHLKVVALGSWISYYVNQELVASLGDYTLQKANKGQSTYLPKGYFGLLNWNGEMVFQNTYYRPLTQATSPLLDDISVEAPKGSVEAKPQFVNTEPISIQYVSHEADKVKLVAQPRTKGTVVTVTDPAGKTYAITDEIPVAVGRNDLTVTSRLVLEDGTVAEVSYRVNVHRRQSPDVYYNELYRGQYHYSVKDGWGNDPNGLVYYKGVYHFFYQFYDDNKWGPMHWGHAVSKDLIHWEEKPIAFYPDENGAMFSGAMVIDEHNTSGLFEEGKGGLVALITADGNGQRVKLAYSTDEGETWTKVDKIAADWTDDPLQSRDFRDPKVFRWEGKWFMVIAGGPLRIYSSTNLLEWQAESTYADLHTECPDLFPLYTEDGGVKWVLSRGGRGYKVGDFLQVDGKWTFLADEAYKTSDGVMNFGKDSYAAMSYYVQDFGTAAKPSIPKLIMSNWMNTWDYCNLVGDALGQAFNGTYNLNLQMGLRTEDGVYKLTQTPIDGYKELRNLDQARLLTDVAVTSDNTLLSDFQGTSYEIVSTFRPDASTKKVGFHVRAGEDEMTQVIYDLETETLSIDRSRSGVILNAAFAEVNKQTVTRNADGSIDLHLYVDKSSVEVFAKGYTVAGANQIFASPTNQGLKVVVEGGSAQADIAVYPIRSIWADKKDVTTALALVPLAAKEQAINVGDQVDLRAYIMPDTAVQDVVWSVDREDLVTVVNKGNSLSLTGLKRGTVKITASAKDDASLSHTFTVNILENNFKTNIPGMTAIAGNWYVDDVRLLNTNISANDYYMSGAPLNFSDYSLEFDLVTTKGLINVFLASETTIPHQAYSLQFGSGDTVRLFRFAGETILEKPMGFVVSDGQKHRIKLRKIDKTLTVFVDEKEVMAYTFDNVDAYFFKPYVGLGLWDGNIGVENLMITDNTAAKPNDSAPKGYHTVDGQLYYYDSKGVQAKGLREHGSGTIRYYDPKTGASVTNRFIQLDNGDSYYFDKNGRALKGYHTIDGQLYYFDSKGRQAKGLREHGSGTIRYYDPKTGVSVTNRFIQLDNGDSYYFDKHGRALKGEHVIEGVVYHFGKDGRLIKG